MSWWDGSWIEALPAGNDWPAQIRAARRESGLLTLDDEVRVAREMAET